MLRPVFRIAGLGLATALVVPAPLVTALASLGSQDLCAKAGVWALHRWCKLACRTLGVRVSSEGEPVRGAALFTSNHLGYLDILVLGSLYPTHFVSMAEVERWPLVGPLARLVGTIFVERGKSGEARRLSGPIDFHLAHGRAITIFPEGRTSPGLTVQEFRSGLLQAPIDRGVPCVPVTLTYEAPGAAEPPSLSVCWWGEAPFVSHFRKLLDLPRIEAKVRFGPPLRGSERKQLALDLQAQVHAALVPVRQSHEEDSASNRGRTYDKAPLCN